MLELNIMLIDDDVITLDIVQMMLSDFGIPQVIGFSDGYEALNHLKNGHAYDIICVDLQMPTMDGIEVLRHLRHINFQGGLLLMSGEDQRILSTAEQLAKEHDFHFLGALEKPIERITFEQILKKYQPRTHSFSRSNDSQFSAKELIDALFDGYIVPYFQPKINVRNMSVDSVEVLARWEHPKQGLISPDRFLPIAYANNFIDAITRIMIRKSLQCLANWGDEGIDIGVAINVSEECINKIDFPEQINDLCALYNVPRSKVTLEVIESSILSNRQASLDVLTRLRLHDIGLSIDDFGTGFSSFTQLKTVPFTELKIDRSFVHGAKDNAASYAILESSAELAKKLNMKIVAEGVENKQDFDVAKDVGSDLIQGFYIAKPMSEKDFLEWITTWDSALPD